MTMSEKRIPRAGLGRGLSALMADVAQATSGPPEALANRTSLPVELLVANPDQPRQTFEEDALSELAASVREKGIVQPLIVRPGKAPGTYEIVAGERRWRAAQLAGLFQVPVVVRNYSDEEVLEVSIIENIQRADLNSVDEANAYKQLMDRFGHTQEKLATSLSRSRSHIANTLRLLALPPSVQELLRQGKLTAGHARALITTNDAEKFAREVVAKGLSVRDTERLAKRSIGKVAAQGQGGRGTPKTKDADTLAIEADLSANLGMRVSISHNGVDEGGVLSVSYRTLDDLDLLCDILSKITRDVRAT